MILVSCAIRKSPNLDGLAEEIFSEANICETLASPSGKWLRLLSNLHLGEVLHTNPFT